MNIINVKMMIIILNNQVNCLDYNQRTLKEFLQIQQMQWKSVTDDVKRRHIRHCYKADPEYGKGVAKALGIDINSIDLETENDETYENFEK